MATSQETFQVSTEAAEIYESRFVPAMFAEWAPHLVDLAGVAAEHAVLDVACGTGVVAREVASRLGNRGRVVGVDLNEGMLKVARRVRPDLEWHQGDAADLPFADNSFNSVLCQSALMFFPDRARAIREMARVVVPDGIVAVQVWGALEDQPAYGPFFQVALQHVGPEAANLLTTYWVLGDLGLVRALFEGGGLEVVDTVSRTGTARFESVEQMVSTEVNSTPLGARISPEMYGSIVENTRAVLQTFTADGRANIPIRGHLVAGRKPRPDP